MPNKASKYPLIIAHRGDSAHAMENSLTAFAQAVSKGADGVEMDVWRCGSGEIVVCHDRQLTRLTKQAGDLKKLPLKQLSSYTLSSGDKIPTLAEVLEVVSSLSVINIEIKDLALSQPKHSTPWMALLQKKQLLSQVVVSSFHPLILYRLKKQYPYLKIGLLFQKNSILMLRRAWAARLLKPYSLHPEVHLLSQNLRERAKIQGQKVIAWTVNDGHDVERCLELGVDGIITDDPGWLRQTLSTLA